MTYKYSIIECDPLKKYVSRMHVSFSLYSERSGSVVECLTRDPGSAGSSLTGVTALCH